MKAHKLNIIDFEIVFDDLESAHYRSADTPTIAFFNRNSGEISRPTNDTEIDECLSCSDHVAFPQKEGSLEMYGRILEFIDSVEDGITRILLDRAVKGRGAVRRFKNLVEGGDDEGLKDSWSTFQKLRRRERVVDWLNELGVEPDWGCDIFESEGCDSA